MSFSQRQIRSNIIVLLLGLLLAKSVVGFSSGAPAGVCYMDALLGVSEPRHGLARAQPLDKLPYTITASSDRYEAGQTLNVTITGTAKFRGFFLQAHDAKTGRPVGVFMGSKTTKLLSDCATITHANSLDKSRKVYKWQAPSQQSGGVYFT